MTSNKKAKRNPIIYMLLAYLLLAGKELIFYWQTDRLDMMNVIPVPLLSYLFLVGIFELFSYKESRRRRWGFYIVYFLVTLLMFADAAYSSYFGQYLSVNQLYQLGSLGQIAADGNVLGASVNPACLLCLVDYPLMVILYQKRNQHKKGMFLEFFAAASEREDKTPKKEVIKKGAVIAAHILLYGLILAAFWYYGTNPYDYREVQKINHIEYFTYHTNDLIVNVGGKFKRKEIDEEELLASIEENVPKSSGDDYRGAAKGMNLILIQVESLNNFVLKKDYNGEEITPFLNTLLENDTLYFNHFYSTTGVGNTADAEFSTLNSLYGNTERECYRKYVDNTFHGLPWLLRQEGYQALAFHGYVKTFWNREEAYKNQGFERFYSEEDFNITQTAGFGLTDKEMFSQSIDILKDVKEPFFSFMITLTNHIPYELDDSLASLSLKEEDKDTLFGNYLRTVRYTDEALEELVTLLKENDMYDNTMIVIYGDHQGMNLETPSVQYSVSKFLGKEYDYDEMLNVPLIIHIPGLSESKTITTVGGEVDTMPTIAGLMDLELTQPYVFGHDLLNAEEGFVAQISYVGKGSFLTDQDDLLFIIGKDGMVESGRLLDLTDGTELNVNTALCEKLSSRAVKLIDTCQEALDYNLIANYVTH